MKEPSSNSRLERWFPFRVVTSLLFPILSGCEPDPVPVTASSPVHEFTAKEESLYKSAAWEAASSPAMRARFKVGRLGSGPIQWTPERIRYESVDRTNSTAIEVFIPSGRFGYHPSFIGVVLDRETCEVIDMRNAVLF